MGYFRVVDITKVDGIEKEIEKFRFKDFSEVNDPTKFHNHFTSSGKQFCMDFMFNGVSWLTGAAWNNIRYAGVGNSTNTNAGVSGPTGVTSLSLNGSWQGVDDNDWKLSNEINTIRPQITTLRAGNTTYLRMKFTDDNFTDGATTEYHILEIGLFLSGLVGYPQADPTQSTLADNRNNAMIVRGVSYYNDGTGYRSKTIVKSAGDPLYIDYVFADFEG